MNPSPAQNLDTSDSNRRNDNSQTPMRDKRKTKRFIWTDDLHIRFVSAIFELGMKNASPKALLALMETKCPTEGLTTEHIKSHLQKYRINHERSQRLNEKRSFKRHRRQIQQREVDEDDLLVPIAVGVPTTTQSQDTSQSWNVCDALLRHDEVSEQNMHSTMQQRMDFHRELLLTRSVEVGSGQSWATRMNNLDSTSMANTTDSNYSDQPNTEDSSFLQAWANAEQLRQQEEQVYGRLHEQQQSLFQDRQDVMPVAAFTMSASKPESSLKNSNEDMNDDGGVDLSSWGRLSLTVDSDDEDVFGFLGESKVA